MCSQKHHIFYLQLEFTQIANCAIDACLHSNVLSCRSSLPPNSPDSPRTRPLVILIWQIQVPYRSLLRQNYQPYHTSRAAIPFYRFPQSSLHKVDAFLLTHIFLPIRVTVSVDVCTPRPTNSVRLLVQAAPKRYTVDRTSMPRIIPRNYHTGTSHHQPHPQLLVLPIEKKSKPT